jgi:YegS/Rv2252/BmrU family lipid kinase
MNDAFFVVNPRAAGGRTGGRWEAEIRPLVTARFGVGTRWALTSRPGEAAGLAERACREGAGLVVAVGGDGTLHEVVNGLLAAETAERPLLGLLPNGTGCDFARTIGMPREPSLALDALAAGRFVAADVCEIACTGSGGERARRYSINTCGCGIGGEVAASVNRAAGPRHGFLAFLLASLAAVARYRPREVGLVIDGGVERTLRLLALFVCSGEYCGGGMRPGRGARIDDGWLRVVTVEAMPPARVLLNLPRLYSGRLEGVRGVSVHDAVRHVEVRGGGGVLVDCDGEQPGTAPATFDVRPGALRVVVGRRSRVDQAGRPVD